MAKPSEDSRAPEDTRRAKESHLLKRRELLQLGAASLAALGAGSVPLVARAGKIVQGPGSGQGPQPPRPPALDDIVNPLAVPDENWSEPWVWRPSEWPDATLDLHVVGNRHPPRGASPGNQFTPVFSFNGSSPAPTVRMRGDETLKVKLRNLLIKNSGQVPAGSAPDPFEIPLPELQAAICRAVTKEGAECAPPFLGRHIFKNFDEMFAYTNAPMVDTSRLRDSSSSPHGTHTTNLHTHGLHVEPGTNPNGTFADDVFLNVLPRGDWDERQSHPDPAARQLAPHERVAEADLEHPLGDVQRAARLREGRAPQPHPPGTHWYHPHKHGATQDQVASGMAGFLIVEGDVDDAINEAMTGTERPDPTQPTGPFDYRERLMMIQRVEVSAIDFDAGPRRQQARFPSPTAVNGGFAPTVMYIRPGAVERWRVLNASTDGRGFKNFMVLEGHFVFSDRQLWRVTPADGDGAEPTIEAASRQDVEDAKVQLHQLAFDGLTLVTVENGLARHTIKDLSQQNSFTRNPLNREPDSGEAPTSAMLRNVEDCYRDRDSIRNAHVRPNQVFLANANRADVFFKVPTDAAGKVYTVFAQEFGLQTDNLQARLQVGVAEGNSGFLPANPAPVDVVVGYVRVAGEPVPGGNFDVMSLRDRLPDVPPFLQPVEDEELRVPAAEAATRGVAPGSLRTRVLSYSGLGPTEFPLIEVPVEFTQAHPELRTRVWEEIDGTAVLLAPFSRTMAINPEFDLAANPEPPPPRKFAHNDEVYPRPLIETAEEWVLYNNSMPLWSHTDLKRFPQPGQFLRHYRGYPLSRSDGQARFARDPEFQITAKGADHPFHIHVNPMWVTRIEVPDEQGRLHNILEAPRWMDTVSIPRDGGRVVFRSRFSDYTGKWVNHCHILIHEDFGMMQAVEAVANPQDANYNPRTRVAAHAMRPEDVSAIYPRPSRELMYKQNLSFVDASPTCGQEFPGFDIELPKLED